MDPSQAPRLVVAAGLVWLSPRRILLQRRSGRARHGAGMLEFPGGKIERGEGPAAALGRELVEEWGPAAAQLRVGPVAEILHHVYPPPGPEVLLCVYHVDAAAWGNDHTARVVTEEGARAIAFEVGSVPVGDFLAADRPFAEAIVRGDVVVPDVWSHAD